MHFHRGKYEMDMTTGSILPKILLFAMPLMLSSILQLLFNAADVIVVGRFEGENALAAVGSTGALINLIVTMPCGYALSKKTLPGRGVFMAFFMFIMYFSGGMIPTFLLVNSLRLYNTRAILVILGAFSTYNCIICRTFFLNIPKELEEAAEIDGSSV